MTLSRAAAVAAALAVLLAACSGGAGGSMPPASTPTPPASTPTPPATPSASTSFTFSVNASVKSVAITLNTVNGAPPSSITSVTANITQPCSPCAVSGPSVPPGSDNFTVTAFDAASGGGNHLAANSSTFAIVSGQTNNNTVTLAGIPASFSITGLPSGTAGTPFGSPKSFGVAVKDADGNTLTGPYANAVTLTDSDASSLTLGTALSVNGGSAAQSVRSTASTDAMTINYGGLAISPAAITASATGAANGTATFSPTLQPIVYSGPTSGGNPEIDLYATSGAGSSGTFTASEAGWTNAPYNKSITATESSGCSTIATTSPAGGTSFGTTSVASPAAGTCTMTLSDFSGGNTKSVTITYTTSGLGVN